MKTQNILAQTLAAVLAVACLNQVVRADDLTPPNEFKIKSVNYADININSKEGADRLYHRIAAAAQHVCGGDEQLRALANQTRVRMCIEQSIEHAVATINQPTLTAVLMAKTGRSAPVVLADRR